MVVIIIVLTTLAFDETFTTLTLCGPNSFFRRFSGHNLYKIGSFRLPTHRRDAHRKFFYDPLT